MNRPSKTQRKSPSSISFFILGYLAGLLIQLLLVIPLYLIGFSIGLSEEIQNLVHDESPLAISVLFILSIGRNLPWSHKTAVVLGAIAFQLTELYFRFYLPK